MSRRPTAIAAVIASVLIAGALLVAAASDRRATAFTLDVADNHPIAVLGRGASLCQGPIEVTGAFNALRLWARPAHRLVVSVLSADATRVLAARQVVTSPSLTGAVTVPFGATTIFRGTEIRVCVADAFARRVVLAGGEPSAVSGVLTVTHPLHGPRPLRVVAPVQRAPAAIALLFLRPHPPTLLSLLPTVFTRASLFKARWVGAWVFWVLAICLLLAFAAGGGAVLSALADERSEP